MPLTVFLCSTYSDLADERERILDAVRRLQLQHDSMEFFGARADLPIETCIAEVRRSDVLFVVVGHRYGSIVPGRDISYSEAEYQEGRRLGKPCLVYMRDEKSPILPKDFERDPEKLKKLDAWKTTLNLQHTVAAFNGASALAVQVTADLSRTIQALRENEQAKLKQRAGKLNPTHQELERILAGALDAGVQYPALLSAIRRAVSELLASSGRRRPTIFLSHASADKSIVRKVAQRLKTQGIEPWLDESELGLGDSLIQTIEAALDSSDFVAFFISNASMNSPWVRQEMNATISRKVSEKRGAIVIPILLDNTEIPPLLRDVICLDMRNGELDENVSRLTSAIERLSLQRLHTYTDSANRYFTPPAEVRDRGREVKGASFAALIEHLREGEVLFGLYTNQAGALVATHLHSEFRLNEMETLGASERLLCIVAR